MEHWLKFSDVFRFIEMEHWAKMGSCEFSRHILRAKTLQQDCKNEKTNHMFK